MTEIIIITGMSGAGKSCAVNCFEDLGYYCIDNLPPALIKNVVELVGRGGRGREAEKAVFVIDIRGGEFFDALSSALADLKAEGGAYEILFLDAANDVLQRRYSETRRTHPLSDGGSNMDGIARERKRLAEIKRLSDTVIDTSAMKSADLNAAIKKRFLPQEENVFTVDVMSFGFKFGIPAEADMVFDMRFIPNPFYVPSLKEKSGRNKQVRDYVMKAPESGRFMDATLRLVEDLIPGFAREGKYRLNLAFGCTGGRHRSVTMAILFHDALKKAGRVVTLRHRDL